jgi:5-methylcytosine-specific restriction endonuclease McrA
MSEAPLRRKQPSPTERREILQEQGGCCAYCDVPFGGQRRYHGRLRRLSLVWDHFVPWSMMRNNEARNFVASCSLCNGIKTNCVFDSIEDVRAYVEKAYADGR